MDKRQITSLALRLFGLYAAISAVSVVGPALRELSRLSEPSAGYVDAFYGTSSLVAWSTAAVVLLRFASSIADRWCAGEPATAPDANSTIRARDLELVGFRVLGVLAIVSNLPGCVDLVVNAVRWDGVGLWPEVTWWETGNLLTVALGLWLLLGSRGIAALVDRVRGAGLEPAEQAWKTSRD